MTMAEHAARSQPPGNPENAPTTVFPRVPEGFVPPPASKDTSSNPVAPIELPPGAARPEVPPKAIDAAPGMPAPDVDTITCPECGTVARVTVNRRDAVDFCRTCDFPLFWTPAAIVREQAGRTAEESLRRLPGQRGRAAVASLPCPHCAELNSVAAETCIRCGLPMHPVAPPPPVAYVPPPPAPAPPPPAEDKVSWWVWALLILGAAVLITLIVLIATGTIH
jgi:hypothetical protein